MRAARRAAALFDGLVVALNALGSAWIFFIMGLVCVDIAARYLLNHPVAGVPLVITMSLIAILFLQLPDALRSDRVTRNDAVLGALLQRRPRLGYALEAFYYLAAAALLGLLAFYVAPMAARAWHSASYLGSMGYFTLPEWPFKWLIVLGATVSALQCLLLAGQRWRRRTAQ